MSFNWNAVTKSHLLTAVIFPNYQLLASSLKGTNPTLFPRWIIHPIRLLMCFGNQYSKMGMWFEWYIERKYPTYTVISFWIESCNVSNIPSSYTVVSNHPRIHLFPMVLTQTPDAKTNWPPLFCWSMSSSSNYISK
jgi:hypothetical protein